MVSLAPIMLPNFLPLLRKIEPVNTALKAVLLHTSINNNQKVWNTWHFYKPDTSRMNLKFSVKLPEKYTVEPLKIKHLGGRDPLTGRVLCNKIGGGRKHEFHWVDFHRVGPKVENEYYVEKVLEILPSGIRTAFIALVGSGNKLRYILATINMKPGDLIKTSQYIPKNPVRPNEGDAFPLGALPADTKINSLEPFPGFGGEFVNAAGSSATVIRRLNNRVIVKMPSKKEISFDENCMATVGQLSNPDREGFIMNRPGHFREFGIRPKSGLYQKKTGRFGRKIKPPKPPILMKLNEPENYDCMRITFDHIPILYHPKMFE